MRMRYLVFGLFVAGCDAPPSQQRDEIPPWSAVEDLRIGDTDATGMTFFRNLVVDDAGYIVTPHRQENLVRVHAPDGSLHTTIGREGEGPGEFKGLGAIGLVGDSIWAMDFSLFRLTYFTRDGEVLGSREFRIDLGRGGPDDPPRPNGLLSDGTLWGQPPTWSREVARGAITEALYLRMSPTGEVLDTLGTRSVANTVLEIADPNGAEGSFGSYSSQPFSDSPLLTLSPFRQELLHVDRSTADREYGLRLVTYSDDTVFSVRVPYSPIPISSNEVDSIIDGLASRFEDISFPGAPTPARAAQWARTAFYVPDHKPPISDAKHGRDGTVWVRRGDVDPGQNEWICFDRRGAPIGTVAFPSNFRLMTVDRTRAWGQLLDELDVPHILRFTLSPDPS